MADENTSLRGNRPIQSKYRSMGVTCFTKSAPALGVEAMARNVLHAVYIYRIDNNNDAVMVIRGSDILYTGLSFCVRSLLIVAVATIECSSRLYEKITIRSHFVDDLTSGAASGGGGGGTGARGHGGTGRGGGGGGARGHGGRPPPKLVVNFPINLRCYVLLGFRAKKCNIGVLKK